MAQLDTEWSRDINDFIDFGDAIVFPVFLFILFIVTYTVKKNNISLNPAYKYYSTGLFIKIFGGIIFTLIYLLYYGDGDTINYFWGARSLSRLFLVNSDSAFSILMNNRTMENFLTFNDYTKWPMWTMYFKQGDSYSVSRFTSIFSFLSFNSWFGIVVLLNWAIYQGVWKFFLMVCELYPQNIKLNAYAVLFIPSAIFWGSGVMKDTYTYSAALWFTYTVYMIFIKKQKLLPNIIMMAITIYLMVSLKPYIFITILPGAILWSSFQWISKLESNFLKVIAGPFLIAIGVGLSVFGVSKMGDDLGQYSSVDKIVEKAQITQKDLKRAEQYGTGYFDIGDFDGSFSSLASKAPMAIIAGLYRPFVWEAKSVVMMISALENLVLISLTIFILLNVGFSRTFKLIREEPLLLFSMMFAIFFSFSVGLTTANFGALVRYKIPALPFFTLSLFILYGKAQEIRKERLENYLKGKR